MLTGRDNETNRRASSARGLTLVEVVAALVILGILLALMVKASTQSSRQLALAEQRLAAAKEADRIIAGWFAAGTPIEPGLSGQVPGTPTLYWETVARDDAGLQPLGAKVVQLRMFARAGAGDGASADGKPLAASERTAPVLSVDLLASVLPLPELPPEDPSTAATRPSDTEDNREDPRLRQPPAFVHQP